MCCNHSYSEFECGHSYTVLSKCINMENDYGCAIQNAHNPDVRYLPCPSCCAVDWRADVIRTMGCELFVSFFKQRAGSRRLAFTGLTRSSLVSRAALNLK